jgi:hypothetical protein
MGQGQVHAGIYPEGMFRTFDNGNTWEEMNNGLSFTRNGDYLKGIAINDIAGQWVPVNTGLPPEPTGSARDLMECNLACIFTV